MNEVGENKNTQIDMTKTAKELLDDAKETEGSEKTFRVPIDELNLLGMSMASLAPALRTITTNTTVPANGLFRLANAEVGEVLKVAKDGNCWGALRRPDKTSKMAKFSAVAEQTSIQTTVVPIDPTTMMIAVALYSVEKQMSEIKKIGQEIVSFLESEKESKIEGDVETLLDVIVKYKYKWDDKLFVSTSYKLIFDIQRTARENMNLYQKKVKDSLNSNNAKISFIQSKGALKKFLKDFKYYRMALYTFSMSSFLEIMLGGKFQEDYIKTMIHSVEEYSLKYRELYSECYEFLEKQVNKSFQTNALKGIGIAGEATGKLIGKIPVVKKGKLDEFLQSSGNHLKDNADDIEKEILKAFAEISNPKTGIFIQKMEDINLIYNHTKGLAFDEKNIYLEA